MTTHHSFVGSKIKGIRESKNISIEEVSERSGLSTEQINSIETDQNLPSLGPLIKIARALGVRLGTFLDDSDALGPIVCRAADHQFQQRCIRCPQTHGIPSFGTAEGRSTHGAIRHRHQPRRESRFPTLSARRRRVYLCDAGRSRDCLWQGDIQPERGRFHFL